MNQLYRDCFFFAATATLLGGCCTPAVVTEPGTAIRKVIKADGKGGIVEESQNLQLADKTRDRFTAIGRPQTHQIINANFPPPKREGTYAQRNRYHIEYHIKYNWIMASLGVDTSTSNAVQTSNQNAGYLRYRIWIPTDLTDNTGQWSPWTKSNDLKGPDMDNSNPSLSGTLLEPGEWQLLEPSSYPNEQDKTVTIKATVKDSKGNQTQYTWTGIWKQQTKYGTQDPTERGSITWTVTSP